MKVLLLVASLVVACSGASFEIVSAPSSLKFPDTSATLKTTQVSTLNEYVMGLSARPVEGFNVETDIFSRPRALAVVSVIGVDGLNMGKTYKAQADGIETLGFEQDLALLFGQDRESVQTSAGGITGSKLALSAQQQKVDTSSIKTKNAILINELESAYKLINAIKASGIKLDNSADVFRVSFTGLTSIESESEKATAVEDIKNAVNALNAALSTVYGGQAVVEVVSFPADIKAIESEPASDAHVIRKRDANPNDVLEGFRKKYQVSVWVSADYPAIFAIFFGLVLVLVLALIYIVAGMLSIDPEKDSIIYRMTTTRMKKD